MIRGSSVAESGETGTRLWWFVSLSGKSALSRGSLGLLGRNMHADDSGVSRGRVGAESGEKSAFFVAPSATSGRSRGTFLSSRSSFGTDKQDSNINGRILGAFLARSGQMRS